MNLSTKQKHTHREQTYGCQGEDWTEGTVGEFGLDMYTRLYLKRTTSKGLVG